MGPTPQPHHRPASALVAGALTFLATACAGAQGGHAPDCPVPTSATETVRAPASCEDAPGGVGY